MSSSKSESDKRIPGEPDYDSPEFLAWASKLEKEAEIDIDAMRAGEQKQQAIGKPPVSVAEKSGRVEKLLESLTGACYL